MTLTTYLMAVLVPASATTDTIAAHLAAPMHFLPADRYQLGGPFTGAWDENYNPHTDPANWRPCSNCTTASPACPLCGDAEAAGRAPRTVLAPSTAWAAHPGDLVPLPRLLDPAWRFPTGGQLDPARDTTAPEFYADQHYGLRALDQSDSGEISVGLRTVLQAVLISQTHRGPGGAPVDPAAWQLALVAADISDAEEDRHLPIIGSVVLITDPAHRHGEPADRLYVVYDNFSAPHFYDLVALGDYGPRVPGYAITEVDPARVRLDPAPDGALPFPPRNADPEN